MELRIFTKENRNKFIEENKTFIYSITEYFCNRQLDWSKDHELNIALLAFNRACESQSELNTNFLGYANALIQSALIKYYIKLEEPIPLSLEVDNKLYLEYVATLGEFEMYFDNKARASEIVLLSEALKKHKISFKDLQNITFNDKTLKINLFNLVLRVCKDDSLAENVLSNKSFNMDSLSPLTTLDWEVIKKHKKFIIMLLLVFSQEEYIYFKSYLNIRVGDSNA